MAAETTETTERTGRSFLQVRLVHLVSFATRIYGSKYASISPLSGTLYVWPHTAGVRIESALPLLEYGLESALLVARDAGNVGDAMRLVLSKAVLLVELLLVCKCHYR